MPWTKKQQATARAVEHGWKPKGSARGFTKDFVAEVVDESKTMKMKRAKAESMLGKGARMAPKR